MAAAPSVDSSFTFVGGLYTEGSFFLTPKNSWKEGDNVVPLITGAIVRRPGIDFETNYTLDTSLNYTSSEIDTYAFTVETWAAVGGNGNLDLFVVQQGPKVEFYKAFSGAVGATKQAFSIDLNNYRCFGNNSVMGTNVITTTSCYGRLLITSVDIDPILVTYVTETASFSAQRLELGIRDFEGIRSPAAEFTELSSDDWESQYGFFTEATYNLYNQGWTKARIDAYVAAVGKLPANTKQWWYGKDSNDDFSPTLLNKQDFGSSYAPRGRFIIKAFYQDRAAVSGLTAEVPAVSNINDYRPFSPFNIFDERIQE